MGHASGKLSDRLHPPGQLKHFLELSSLLFSPAAFGDFILQKTFLFEKLVILCLQRADKPFNLVIQCAESLLSKINFSIK
jgi:flavorubredoxin